MSYGLTLDGCFVCGRDSLHMSDFMIIRSVDLLPVTYVDEWISPVEYWLDVGVTEFLDSPYPGGLASFLLLKKTI